MRYAWHTSWREECSRPGGAGSGSVAVDCDTCPIRTRWQVVLRLLLVSDDTDVTITRQEASLIATHEKVVNDLAKTLACRCETCVLLTEEGKTVVDGLRWQAT